MEFIWILFAFFCGLLVKLINLPPLIGFLIAGFALNAYGVQPSDSLNTIADLGITLMLFTIGLKLHVKDLLKREVWAGTLSHMVLWSGLFIAMCLFGFALSLPYFTSLDWQTSALVGFALSFSSTVCIIKLLEESGELKTRHGQISLAILVMQDIVAVVFLVVATGTIPSIGAIALFGLILARPLFGIILNKAGHGEMLPLAGIFLALAGYELFYLFNVKGDLGALIFGILLSSHPKASELTKSLMSFKDLFLIAFFLSIGFTALPTFDMLISAFLVSFALILKFALFFGLFILLRLRGRTAFLTALAMSNYSEFGLIVAQLSVDSGWLDKEFLVILALAVSISFVVTSLLYRRAHDIYHTYQRLIRHFEKTHPLAEDTFIQPDKADILVVGLGRVGCGSFHSLRRLLSHRVVGMDADRKRIERMKSEGHNVFFGDGEDADLWEKFDVSDYKLVLLALPSIEDSSNITIQLRKAGFNGKVAAIARYQDERDSLITSGIDNVFNFYTEAGNGFAEESIQLLEDFKPSLSHNP